MPLGVLEQAVWVRLDEDAGKSQKRHERPFVQKESYKWVNGLPCAEITEQLPQSVVVCDAESHIYEFFDLEPLIKPNRLRTGTPIAG